MGVAWARTLRTFGRWWRPVMNPTSNLAIATPTKSDFFVMSKKAGQSVPRPRSWSYMHRAKWARALPVSPGARFTAVCIADHINEKTGRWDLSAVQIAAECGRIGKHADRAVRRHVNDELRPYFGVEDRPGRMWRFTIPTPIMQVIEPPAPRTKCPDPPDKMSDVPSKEPCKYVPAAVVVSTSRQQQQLTDRSEGLFAACAVRARKLGLTYDEADERARFKAGKTNIGRIQRLADKLGDDIERRGAARGG